MPLSIPLLVTAAALAVAGTDAAADDAQSFTTEVRDNQVADFDSSPWILRLPQLLVETAFLPVLPVALAFEKGQIHRRAFDLFTNDEHTLALVPVIDFIGGRGYGGAFLRNEPFGSQDRMVVFGLLRENGDRSASLSYKRRLRYFNGRVYQLSMGHSKSSGLDFYGIEASQKDSVKRSLKTEDWKVSTSLSILDPSLYHLDLSASVGYLRRTLGRSSDHPNTQSPGLGRALDYPRVSLSFGFDSRDSFSRPSRGWVLGLSANATRDMNGAQTSALKTTLKIARFISVLPRRRVLLLAAGASAAVPLQSGHEVPLHELVDLGGNKQLRGYDKHRFTDRAGWWATAEYRYPIFDDGGSGNGFTASLFVDTGKVGRNISDLGSGHIPYSVGLGLRAETNLFLLGRFHVAYSPEGVRVVATLGEVL